MTGPGRMIIWALAFSLGLNIVLVGMVVSHLSQGAWTGPQAVAAPRFSSPATHVLQFDEKRLKLTPEQRERFREIRDAWLESEKKAKETGVQRISRLSTLLVRDNATTQTLQPVFKDLRDHSDDFFVRLSQSIQAYRAALNPEQQVVFNQMLQERFNALQRFTRQRSSEFEQRILQAKARERKNENKKNEKQKGKKGKNAKAETAARKQDGGDKNADKTRKTDAQDKGMSKEKGKDNEKDKANQSSSPAALSIATNH